MARDSREKRACKAPRRCLHRSTNRVPRLHRVWVGEAARCAAPDAVTVRLGMFKVTSRHERNLVTEPYLIGDAPRSKPVTLVFWSGGKDAYLALLEHLLEKHIHDIVLVTVCVAETDEVSHQDVYHIDVIKAQATALKLYFTDGAHVRRRWV